jgi:carboxylesterase type B
MDVASAFQKDPHVADAMPQELVTFGEVLGASAKNTFNEDCLTLNVWTKPQTGEKKKAVMIWIYGGGKCSPTAS